MGSKCAVPANLRPGMIHASYTNASDHRCDFVETILTMVPEKTTCLEQRGFLRGSQRFEIRPDGDLEVTVRRFHLHNQFKVPLWALDPACTRMKYMQVGSFVGMLIFGLATAGVVVSWLLCARHNDFGLAGVVALPLIFFGGLFAACLWRWRIRSVNSVVYYFRSGGGRLHLWHDKPEPGVFKEFCETLTQKAREAWNCRPIDPNSQSLAGELAALKQLKDSGVISDADFERAKDKLLPKDAEEKRRIGFK